jgi:photosystem II stability/assembly factor-like uncharacterized protein
MNSDMNDEQRLAGQEAVPAALLDIHQRLLEDGAVWRDDLPFGATHAAQAFPEGTTPQRPAHERSERNGRPPMMTPLPDIPRTPRREVNWARRLVASAAIIVVVGLLGALFATFARGRTDTHVAASPTPGPLAAWSAAPHLANQPIPPILAPSDPSVVYEAGVTGANSQHVLRRSDDEGATWKELPVPNSILGAYDLGDLAVWVDPANAKNVIATVGRLVPPELYDRDCPTVQATVAFARQGSATVNTPTSGTGACHLQFFSADGGEHWSDMRLPVTGSITSGWGVSQRTLWQLQSQGTRLYTAIHYRNQASMPRIFVSQDRGATWNLSDTGLYGADHSICDFLAAPDSTTLFATTGATECFDVIAPNPITLWRSDDAGAHWSRIGQLPGGAGQLIGAFKPTGRADFTLYLAALDKAFAPGSDFNAWASEDGGRTWKAAPAQNGRQSVAAFLSEPRDGWLIRVSHTFNQAATPTPGTAGWPTATPLPQDGSGAATQQPFQFSIWSPGQGDWRQIAEPITGVTDIAYSVASVTQDGARTLRTLWTVTQVGGLNYNATYSVRMAKLS